MWIRHHTVPMGGSSRLRTAARRATNRLRQRRAVVSVEFAVLAGCFFILTLGTFEVGYDLFVQEVMNTAVEVAARSVQVGTTKGSSGSQANQNFVNSTVCPYVKIYGLNCNNIFVGVQVVASNQAGVNYYTNMPTISLQNTQNANGDINTGSGYNLMILVAYYCGPSFVGMLVPGFATRTSTCPQGAVPVHETVATAGFVNEGFSGS